MRRGLRALLALAALGWLWAMVAVGQLPRQAQFVAFEAAGVMREAPEAVREVRLSQGPRQVTLVRAAPGVARGVWVQALRLWQPLAKPSAPGAHQHGGVVEKALHTALGADNWTHEGTPLPTARGARLSLATKFLHTARPVRVLSAAELVGTSPAEFGLREDSLNVVVTLAGGGGITLQFGGLTPEGSLQYLRLAGSDAVYLMSRFVGEEWAGVWSDWQP
ncbi:MAG: hypothetical protein EXR83_08035 [Gammaproteobacteria bacterium]|nr:hypothetical protein [Gammaproteobacteria bacterium]